MSMRPRAVVALLSPRTKALLSSTPRSTRTSPAPSVRMNSDARVAVSVAKAYASDACREVGNRGVQVQGGMGFTWENDTHLYYRRAKASEIAFGDATYHRERVVATTLDRLSREG